MGADLVKGRLGIPDEEIGFPQPVEHRLQLGVVEVGEMGAEFLGAPERLLPRWPISRSTRRRMSTSSSEPRNRAVNAPRASRARRSGKSAGRSAGSTLGRKKSSDIMKKPLQAV